MASFAREEISIKNLPEEVLRGIFCYLNSKSLLEVEMVCTFWKKICKTYDEDLWKGLNEDLWSSFTCNRPSDINLLTRVQQIPLIKLKKSLLNIDLHRRIEKKDFQRMLMAKLVFHKRMCKELSGNDPRYKGHYLSMYYPDWSLIMPIYKLSYYHSLQDIYRSEILQSELYNIKWKFRFKEQPEQEFESIFQEDYTVHSTMNDQDYTWKFVQDERGQRKIQVESFPYITSTRLADGSWYMEDLNVILKQKESLPADKIPLLDIQ